MGQIETKREKKKKKKKQSPNKLKLCCILDSVFVPILTDNDGIF